MMSCDVCGGQDPTRSTYYGRGIDFAHAHTRDQKALRVPDSAEESLAIQVSFFFGRPGPGLRFVVVVSRTDAQAPTGRKDV